MSVVPILPAFEALGFAVVSAVLFFLRKDEEMVQLKKTAESKESGHNQQQED